MHVFKDDRNVFISSYDGVIRLPINHGDVSPLIEFLVSLKNTNIWYDISEGCILRPASDFRRVAGSIGYLLYEIDDKANAFYIAKSMLYGVPTLFIQEISNYLPCTRIRVEGDTSVEDLIDSLIVAIKG